MPNKEAVVLILDANESMATKVATSDGKSTVDNDQHIQSIPPSSSRSHSSKTRFDCAKEASIAIICDLMVRSKTNEVTVVVLHTETTKNHFYEEDDDSANDDDESKSYCEERADDYCPFPGITEISGNGEVMGIRQPLPDLLRKIHKLKPNIANKNHGDNRREKGQMVRCIGGDFESGLIYAADALHRRTAGKQFDRRIVLLTDAEHKVGNTGEDFGDSDCNEKEWIHQCEQKSSQQRLLVALDSLRAMDCRVQVVGMDFQHAADFDTPAIAPSEIKDEQIESDGNGVTDACTGNYGDSESENEIDNENDDMLEIKRKNEEYLIQLANMTGGFVYASKEIQDILQKVLGSRVVQNPSKRKLLVEIAPGLVLKEARYYKLISKTATKPLTTKLVMVDQDSDETKKNALGDEMLQDLETETSHWNAEDEHEELPKDRRTNAYRFGSDLLPFSSLDEAGLKQHSPVKLTILGYVPDSSIPPYLRIDSPYILTGDESLRCCAAISALAIGLQKSKRAAIATFVRSKKSDPILCGLFPLLENEKEIGENNGTEESSNEWPLRLIIMQLPFSGDVRYPHLDYADSAAKYENNNYDPQKTSLANCCDDLIENLMLPQDILDYQHIPNHKDRSLYKTVVKRVLDKTCDVVATRIDPVSGTDSMDTPSEIKKRAQPAVAAFYETFHLIEKTPSTGI